MGGGGTRARPKAAIQRRVGMLQLQPALRTFVQSAAFSLLRRLRCGTKLPLAIFDMNAVLEVNGIEF
jgi:hypothetical protein